MRHADAVRLYLSSYRVGNDPTCLRSLAGGGARAGICMNACDVFEDRRMVWPRELADLRELGFDATEVDLRDHFGDPAGLRERLASLDLLWVVGGNTFTLARAMHASGFATVGTELVTAGRLTYAGYSAGACVVAPDLEGIHLMDDPDAVPPGYPPDAPADALGWLRWRIVPHWSSDHPETDAADRAVRHLLETEVPFRTLQDGHAVVVDGDDTRIVGRPGRSGTTTSWTARTSSPRQAASACSAAASTSAALRSASISTMCQPPSTSAVRRRRNDIAARSACPRRARASSVSGPRSPSCTAGPRATFDRHCWAHARSSAIAANDQVTTMRSAGSTDAPAELVELTTTHATDCA